MAQQYLAAVGPLNNAKVAFATALNAAVTKPCNCPPGEFDATTVLPALRDLLAAYQQFGVALNGMKTGAPPNIAYDINEVVAALTTNESDFQRVLSSTDGVAASNEINQMGTDIDALNNATRHLRADLQIPLPQQS